MHISLLLCGKHIICLYIRSKGTTMLNNIEYSESFIAYLETLEYDCGSACADEQQLDVEYELAHLHSETPSKYEGICHA